MKIRLFFTLIGMGLLSQAIPTEAMFKSKTSEVLAIGSAAVALTGLSALAIRESFRNKCEAMIEAGKSRYYEDNSQLINGNNTMLAPVIPLPSKTINDTHLGINVSLYLDPQATGNNVSGHIIDYTFTTGSRSIMIYNQLIRLPALIKFEGTFTLT